jgi:SAM-dependent methyltransferase
MRHCLGRERSEELSDAFARRLLFEFFTTGYKLGQSQEELKSLEWRWSMDFKKEEMSDSLRNMFGDLQLRTPEAREAGPMLRNPDLTSEQITNLRKRSNESKKLRELFPEQEFFILQALAETIADIAIEDSDSIRPFSITSADYAPKEKLHAEALAAVDPITRSTAFYRRALERIDDDTLHHEVNIFEPLPYEDESFSLVTVFDGPFATPLPEETRAQVKVLTELTSGVKELYRVLKPGGKIIIWPFGPLLNDRVDMDAVAGVITALNNLTPPVDGSLKIIFPDELVKWMTDAEREVMNQRGLLDKSLVPAANIKERGIQFGFVIDKPKISKRKTNGQNFYISPGHEN